MSDFFDDNGLPDAAAHMYQSDLEKFKSQETFSHAYSVAVGCPDERSVPLFTLSDMVAYADKQAALKDVEIFGLNSSIGHLGDLVDEAREMLHEAMRAMKALHESATPDDSHEDMDAIVPGAAFAAFVDDHAALLHRIANSSMAPATLPTQP
jgi:hypothetical protein